MKRKAHYLIFAIILINCKYLRCTENSKFGIIVNYSISINQYFLTPYFGFGPSLGLYYTSIPQSNNFGFSTSINYEIQSYIIRNSRTEFTESHYNCSFKHLMLNLSTLRKINNKFKVYLEFGLFIKYLVESPELSITYSSKSGGKGSLIKDNIETKCENSMYQGLNLGISKFTKKFCFQIMVSENIFPSIAVYNTLNFDNKRMDFKIFPLQLYFGVKYNIY